MNLNISTNLSSLPPNFVFRGQPGLASNNFLGFGGTQTLVPINPGNNIPMYNEPIKVDCLSKCKQLKFKEWKKCTNNCR